MGSYRIHELAYRIFINFSGSMDPLIGSLQILADLWIRLPDLYKFFSDLWICLSDFGKF